MITNTLTGWIQEAEEQSLCRRLYSENLRIAQDIMIKGGRYSLWDTLNELGYKSLYFTKGKLSHLQKLNQKLKEYES